MSLADIVTDTFGFILDIWDAYGWWLLIGGIAIIIFISAQNFI